jgi:hypothetical protein
MKSLSLSVLFLSLLAISTSPSSSLAMGRGSNVCEPYQARFCGGLLELGHDKLVACLKEHWDDLSQDCKDVLIEKPAPHNGTQSN